MECEEFVPRSGEGVEALHRRNTDVYFQDTRGRSVCAKMFGAIGRR